MTAQQINYINMCVSFNPSEWKITGIFPDCQRAALSFIGTWMWMILVTHRRQEKEDDWVGRLENIPKKEGITFMQFRADCSGIQPHQHSTGRICTGTQALSANTAKPKQQSCKFTEAGYFGQNSRVPQHNRLFIWFQGSCMCLHAEWVMAWNYSTWRKTQTRYRDSLYKPF